MSNVSETFAEDSGDIPYANVCTSWVLTSLQFFFGCWCNRVHIKTNKFISGCTDYWQHLAVSAVFPLQLLRPVHQRQSDAVGSLGGAGCCVWSDVSSFGPIGFQRVLSSGRVWSQGSVGAVTEALRRVGAGLGAKSPRFRIKRSGRHGFVRRCRQSCVTSARFISRLQRWLSLEFPAVVWLPETWGGF